jgi:hypothetical protein
MRGGESWIFTKLLGRVVSPEYRVILLYFHQPGHKSFSRDRVTRFILGHFLRALRLLVAVGGLAAEAMRILLKAVSVFLVPRMCFIIQL